jgi:hypothetical protein
LLGDCETLRIVSNGFASIDLFRPCLHCPVFLHGLIAVAGGILGLIFWLGRNTHKGIGLSRYGECPLYPDSGHADHRHRCPLCGRSGHWLVVTAFSTILWGAAGERLGQLQ